MTEPGKSQTSVKVRILKIAALNLLVPGIGNIFLDSPRPLNVIGFLLGIWATLHGVWVWLAISVIMTLKACIDVWMEPQRVSRYIADAATPDFGKHGALSNQPHSVSDSVHHFSSGENGFDRLSEVRDSDHILRDHKNEQGGAISSPEQKSVHLTDHEPTMHKVCDPADAYFEQSLPVAQVNHPHWHQHSSADSATEHLSHGTAQALSAQGETKDSLSEVHKEGSFGFGNHDSKIPPQLSHGAAQPLSEFTQHNGESHPHEHVAHPHLVNANKPIEEVLSHDGLPIESHAREHGSSSEQGEFGTIYDIYDDPSSSADTAVPPFHSGGEIEHAHQNSAHHLSAVDQIGMTGFQSASRQEELCPTCQKPREGRRPTCPACGTHFDTDND